MVKNDEKLAHRWTNLNGLWFIGRWIGEVNGSGNCLFMKYNQNLTI